MSKKSGKKSKYMSPDEPLFHSDHKRPVTRRDFLAQGFMAGSGLVIGSSLLSLFASSRSAHAALSTDMEALKSSCGIATAGAGKIPFICFDLAGGANIAGSNVLVGQGSGQLDFLNTAGYSKLGLPGDMLPSSSTTNFVNTELGLAFHTDSAFLRGILSKTSIATRASTNGAVIPARSANDTANNPHNPMYGIYSAGANGELLPLIGSRNSDSGGNSMAPASMIDLEVRPTKVDQASDVTGMVDTGDLVGQLNQSDAVKVMESVARITRNKLDRVSTGLGTDTAIKNKVECAYVKSADLVDRYGDPTALDPRPLSTAYPTGDSNIASIFPQPEFDSDREFRKTASVMKMVINGYAGAGTIQMGGYDYHTGNRSAGEIRDFRAGQCMGACLEYAARVGVPLMLYVFSDGSVSSNGTTDDSADGRGKGVWTGDNGSTAASFFLVYNPAGRATLLGGTTEEQARHQQLGYMTADASVVTSSSPAANNVNLLAETVILNYMALHGEQNNFASTFTNHGLGNSLDTYTAFSPVVNGTIGG
ncbi:MAG: general secretion pathway protein GspF [Gammaproteobacteria bacterium]|nr:general secretion pathway protein GspF [Gammaproteobacteria bacterium]